MDRDSVSGFKMMINKNHVLTIEVYSRDARDPSYELSMDLYDDLPMADIIDSIGTLFVSEEGDEAAIQVADIIAMGINEQKIMRLEDI